MKEIFKPRITATSLSSTARSQTHSNGFRPPSSNMQRQPIRLTSAKSRQGASLNTSSAGRSNEKSLSRSRLHSAGLRSGIMASGSKNQLNMSHSSFNFHSRQPPSLPGEATGRSLASASKLATHLESHVRGMKITDYYDNQSDSIIRRSDS